jgi:hypothetical protein
MMRLAVGLFSVGALLLSVASAWAFNQQTIVSPGSGYATSAPDNQLVAPDKDKNNKGVQPFGLNGPTVQFGVQPGPSSSFGSGNTRSGTPDYYQPLFKGN